MKLKKRIAAITAAMVMAVSTMCATANAAYVSKTTHCGTTYTFTSYAPMYTGDYSYLYAAAGYTQVSATNAGYNNSYKYAKYVEYTESGGTYVSGLTQDNHNTDIVVLSGSKRSVSANAAMRSQSGYVRLTSSNSSSVVDDYFIYIYKK